MVQTMVALLQSLRLKQAVKNTFLFAGLIFSERQFHTRQPAGAGRFRPLLPGVLGGVPVQ
jgi:hypothetical protein